MSPIGIRSQIPSGWICRACSSTARAFSTSSRRSSIHPESPKFLEVPHPPQKFLRSKRIVKGKLPVPKDVFTRSGKASASPAWLKATTPEPQDRPVPRTDEAPRMLWKQRMADSRRRNLREGIMELYERRRRTEKTRRLAAMSRAVDLRSRADVPEHDYETLTRPSVNEVLRDVFKRDHGWHGAPLEERRASLEAHRAAKAAERRDSLHTLYMHARHFITTEADLEVAIETAFTHPDGRPKTESFWDDEGTRPLTTQEMLGATRGADSNLIREERASGRMRKLAEELTGGKITDEWTSGRL